MPLYEYHCGSCDSEFELLVRGNEVPHCPSCSSDRLQKLLSVTAAPSTSSATDCPPMPGGCGLPACGTGICQGQRL